MEQGEPVLVPQWYKLANGNASNNGRSNLRNCSSEHSDENGIGIKTKNSSLIRQSTNSSPLRRSLSSNSSVSKSQAYSSFRRSSRDRNREKGFDSRDRENRSILVDNGLFDHHDLYIGTRIGNEALRRSQSLRTERQVDTWPRKVDDGARNRVFPIGGVINGIRKMSFDKDFPSLVGEGRKAFPDAVSTQSVGVRTAVESLPITAPVIIGSSALAEVPANFVANGSGTTNAPNVNQVSAGSGSTTCLNMAEALVRPPPNVRAAPQLSTDSQRIEELTLKKCKQLIPVTPLTPKASCCNSLEKSKPKVATNGELMGKFGQHSSQIPNRLQLTAGSDNPKPGQAGNLQVLNRERNAISLTANDNLQQNLVKSVKPIVLSQSSAMPSMKKHPNQKLQFDSKVGSLPSSQSLAVEKKLLSQAKNRSDFFNLLRKKSMENSLITPGSRSILSSDLEKLEVQDTVPTSDAGDTQDKVSSECGFNSLAENGDCLSGNMNLLEDKEESNDPYSGPVDPEEEAFLESLGWDKNASVDALTKEEIDGFFVKYEKQRQCKGVPGLLSVSKFN